MNLRSFVVLAAAAGLAILPACAPLQATAQLGYGRVAVSGDIGYVSGSSTASIKQDVESALGLGDTQGAPYARAVLDTGVQVLSASGFTFSDSGTGVLQGNFGSSPLLVAGAPVRSELELTNVKGAYTFDIPIVPGIASLQPGIAVDWFDLHVQVRDLIGIATENVDLQAPIPLAFVRGQVEVGPVTAVAEVGYMKVDVKDIAATLLDIEALLMVQPTPLLHFFVGYRSLALDGNGTIDGDQFDADITVGGLLIGGGVRF